ncbi:MAG: hypothetical protein GWP91_21700, partial [Rhodobacterales bacterium]|nr:hypothetical protein [Rhodobacterales bacterium]
MRAIAVLGVAGAVSGLAVGQLAIGQMPGPAVPEFSFGTEEFHSYDLSGLVILEQTVYQVDEKYVDASRLDWQKMYVSVLQAIETEAPSAVFHVGERAATESEEGGVVVSVEIGEYR